MTDPVALPGKTYRTIHPNSCFIVQKMDETGKNLMGQSSTLYFTGDTLYTEDPAAILQLDATVALPGAPIFVDPEIAHRLKKQEKQPSEEVKERAGDVVEAIAKSGARPS